MARFLLRLGWALLALSSCQQAAVVPDSAAGQLVFRSQCAQGALGARSEQFYGATLWFGPPQPFELQYAKWTVDAGNKPALMFEIIETQKLAFTAMTERCIGRALAHYAGGPNGWEPESLDRLLSSMQEN